MKQAILQCRVDEDLKEAIQKQAEKRHLSVSALMTIYLLEGLNREGKQEEMATNITKQFLESPVFQKAVLNSLQGQLPLDD